MPRKKDESIEMAAINFRCPAELKSSLEDLAASARQDVSAILIELVSELVALNKARIEEFRKAAATPIIKPSTVTPSKPETPKKPARTPRKKKTAAQMDKPIVISKAAYDTILLHVEKINGGQRDFIPVLKAELDKLHVNGNELAKKIVSGTTHDAINQTRLFLSNAPLIIEGDGVKYRLAKLNENYCELDIVDAEKIISDGLKEGDDIAEN